MKEQLRFETFRTRYRENILEIARRYGAEDVRIFGSVARGEASEESDLDILVALRPGTTLLMLAAMERELRELVGRNVDIVSERSVSKYFRDDVLREARVL